MNAPYDPQADEGRSGSSQHVSKKDFKVLAVVLLVFALIAWPVWNYMLGNAYMSGCKRNLRKISSALGQYLADHDNRYPFAYQTEYFGSSDIRLTENGLPYTWQWELNAYIGDNSVFACPAAQEEEYCKTSDGTTTLNTTYGMLFAYSGLDAATIAEPGRRILIGETSNHGSRGTLNPLPLKTSDGQIVKNDGFLIGFNNSNNAPDKGTEYATRLAFPDSRGKKLDSDLNGRHPDGVYFLTAEGKLLLQTGAIARVTRLGGNLGYWDVPKREAPR